MSNLLQQANHLLATGEYGAAEEICRAALKKPALAAMARKMLADCLYNKGMMHVAYSGLMDAAEEAFSEALRFNPSHVLSLNNLGVLKGRAGDLDAATGYYLRALKTEPGHAESLRNLAVAYQRQDRLDEAEAILERLAKIDPANAGLYHLRSALLVRSIIPDAGYPERVRKRMLERLDRVLQSPSASAPPESFAMPYFYLSYHGMPNRELHTAIARAYLHLWPALAWEAPAAHLPRTPGRRLRIGIASSNFYNHSIGHTSRGFVEKIDRALFEVIVIRLGPSPQDAIAKAIDAAADAVITVGTTGLQGMREQIAGLALDILFYQDIGMDPLSYLLSFARLAPVQLTSFGHPDTTGVPNLDYFLSSARYETPEAQAHYSESLRLVPSAGTLSYYHRPQAPRETVLRAEFDLDEKEHLYFCPQTLFKMHPEMDAIFAGIVARDPSARIVLIDPPLPHMRIALEARFRESGIDMTRLTFIARLPHDSYMRLMRCADVLLDTVHFNGQNTNLEALSMELPIVTLPGTMQRERHTLGMIRAMGHQLESDLVAIDAADYAAKATRIAGDAAYREELARRIAQARDVLYEDIGFIRDCETRLAEMVKEKATGVAAGMN